ncbi:MAG: ABC transporter permease [Blautia sp.]|nr:ABC transporter permease [Blautia sp.]
MKYRELFWHKPLFRRKRKEGTVFTVSMVIAMIILAILILCCIFAPIISPYSPTEQNLADSLALPSAQHLLGADKVGRDLLTRLFYGGRTTLISALGVVAFSVIAGVPLGLISGYYGGVADMIIGRICDIVLSFPSLLLAFVFVAGFGRGMLNAVLALGIVYVPMLTRLVRSLTLVEKNKTYVEAATSIGYSDARIMFRHILPNCVSSITVQITLDLAYAILDLASLSFLGLGVQPPTADWGAMLDEGRNFLLMNPYLALAPGAAIVLTVVSLNIFSDGLHQYFEPVQRKLPSFKKVEKRMKRREAE